MILVYLGLRFMSANDIVTILGTVVLGAVLYFAALLLMKNELVCSVANMFLNRINKTKNNS
jgi:hypothetical protein